MLPVSIKLENFVSHANTRLDFDFSSALIVGVHGENDRLSNGSGKTSLLSSIGWALFGESHHKGSDDVVRRGQSFCRVELIFKHDERKYRIVRTRTVKNSKEEVEFEELLSDGKTNPLTGDTNKLTEASIRDTIKSNFEVFVNSSYFRQGASFDFAEGTFSSRQSLIGSLLNLDRWTKYQKAAKGEYDRFDELREKHTTNLTVLKEAEDKLKNVKLSLENSVKENAELLNRESVLQGQLRDLEAKNADNRAALNDFYKFKDLKQRLKHHQSTLFETENSIKSKKLSIEKIKEEILTTENSIQETDSEIEILKLSAQKPTTDLDSLENAVIDGRSKLTTVQSQIKNIQENDECLMCGRPWADHNAKKTDILKREKYRGLITEKLDKVENQLKVVKLKLSTASKSEFELEKKTYRKERLVLVNDQNLIKIKNLETEIQGTQQKLPGLKAQIVELESEIKELSHIETTEPDTVSQLLIQKQEQLGNIRRQINSLVFNIGAFSNEEKTLEKQIVGFGDVRSKLLDATKKAAVYGRLAKIFSRDGVQAIIIDNIIEDLTRLINSWLADFCVEPTYVNFITQKKNTKGDWKETLDIEILTPTGLCKFESLSGGERFRISFAIRLALSILQARRMGGEVQILLLDEVSSSLDPAGLETFTSIIKKLEKTMKILMITHDDKLKEEFDTIITVRKTDQGSVLER